MDPTLIDVLVAKLKQVEVRALPSGLASTKFIAIAAAIVAGAFLLKGNVASILEIIKWGVSLYCWLRVIEGCVHLVCDTVLKAVTTWAATKAHQTPVTDPLIAP